VRRLTAEEREQSATRGPRPRRPPDLARRPLPVTRFRSGRNVADAPEGDRSPVSPAVSGAEPQMRCAVPAAQSWRGRSQTRSPEPDWEYGGSQGWPCGQQSRPKRVVRRRRDPRDEATRTNGARDRLRGRSLSERRIHAAIGTVRARPGRERAWRGSSGRPGAGPLNPPAMRSRDTAHSCARALMWVPFGDVVDAESRRAAPDGTRANAGTDDLADRDGFELDER
jgi:hypothetical protein